MAYAVQKCLRDHKLIFEPKQFNQIDFSDSDLVVKSLFVKKWSDIKEYLPRFDKVLLIVRHPYDRLISQLLYNPFNGYGFSDDRLARRYINLLRKKTNRPTEIPLLDVINLLEEITGSSLIQDSDETCKAILKIHSEFSGTDKLRVIRYEDFIDKNLKHIDVYLDIDMSRQTDVEVGATHQYVARKKSYGDWKNWFTQADLLAFQDTFNEFNSAFDYRSEISPEHQPKIEPEHSYLYTESVINKYRKQNYLPAYSSEELNLKQEGKVFDRAMQALRKREFARASKLVRETLELRSDLLAAYVLLARIHARENRYKQAEQSLNRAITIGKSSIFSQEVPPNLEQLLTHLGNKARAAAS